MFTSLKNRGKRLGVDNPTEWAFLDNLYKPADSHAESSPTKALSCLGEAKTREVDRASKLVNRKKIPRVNDLGKTSYWQSQFVLDLESPSM